MKTTDRYILRIFAGAMTATVVFMLGLYFIIHFLAHVKHQEDATRSFAANGYSLFTGLCRYYAIHMPEVLAMFGPFAILFASMFTLHHLNQNNELVPLFSVGVSNFRAALPIILAALVLSVGLLVIREIVVPGNAREMVVISRMMRGKDNPRFDKLDLIRDAKGNVFHAREWDGTALRLIDVWMLPQGETELEYFDYLSWKAEGTAGLFEPSLGGPVSPERFRELSDLSLHDLPEERRVTRRSSYLELTRQARRRPDNQQLQVMRHEHLAYAFTPLVLLLIGLPLVLRGRKKSVFAGLTICLGLSLAFFTLNMALQRLGAKSLNVDPALAAWLPLIVFASIGLVLFEMGRR